MEFAQYIRISNARERNRIASTCGTTVAYLYQIAGRHRRSGVPLALKIEAATSGAVCRCTLRPDIFPPEECHHTHRFRAPKSARSPIVTKPSITSVARAR